MAKRKSEEAELTAALTKGEAKKLKAVGNLDMHLYASYWHSPEAKKFFLGDPNDDRDVFKVLETRIERLQQVNSSEDGWRNVVDKHDKANLCSSYDIFIIRQRCSILCLAYTYALVEEMNSAQWMDDCCQQAINVASMMGIFAAGTHVNTVVGWNILLKANWEKFSLPNPKNYTLKQSLPELFE